MTGCIQHTHEMATDDLVAAWDALHAPTPPGWYVGRPSHHPERQESVMFAFDPSERPKVGLRSLSGRRSETPRKASCGRWRAACGRSAKAGRLGKGVVASHCDTSSYSKVTGEGLGSRLLTSASSNERQSQVRHDHYQDQTCRGQADEGNERHSVGRVIERTRSVTARKCVLLVAGEEGFEPSIP